MPISMGCLTKRATQGSDLTHHIAVDMEISEDRVFCTQGSQGFVLQAMRWFWRVLLIEFDTGISIQRRFDK